MIRQYQDEMHTISQSYDQIIIEFNHTFKPIKGHLVNISLDKVDRWEA